MLYLPKKLPFLLGLFAFAPLAQASASTKPISSTASTPKKRRSPARSQSVPPPTESTTNNERGKTEQVPTMIGEGEINNPSSYSRMGALLALLLLIGALLGFYYFNRRKRP